MSTRWEGMEYNDYMDFCESGDGDGTYVRLPDGTDVFLATFRDELVDSDNEELIAKLRREARKYEAEDFRSEYIYGSSMDQKTTVVSPRGTCTWMDKYSGIVWVGVHGTDSICVVTKTGVLDVTRVLGYLKHHTAETVLRKFRNTVISELEDLASSPGISCESFGQSIPKPFGVVSVILGTDKVHEESGHEASNDVNQEDEVKKVISEELQASSDVYAEDEVKKVIFEEVDSRQHSRPTFAGYDKNPTVKFLQEQMERDGNESMKASSAKYDVTEATKFLQEKMEASTVDETVKTAISAFQILFRRDNFKANEIEVSVVDPKFDLYDVDSNYHDLYVKHLTRSEIEYHLADINGQGSGEPLLVLAQSPVVGALQAKAEAPGAEAR